MEIHLKNEHYRSDKILLIKSVRLRIQISYKQKDSIYGNTNLQEMTILSLRQYHSVIRA